MKKTILFALCALGMTGALAAEDKVVELYSEKFYDGVSVTAQRYESGNLTAFVAEEVAGRGLVRAQLSYDLAGKSGTFLAFDDSALVEVSTAHDYRNQGGYDTEAALAAQTPRSIALAALLLWEDHRAGLGAVEAAANNNPVPPDYGTRCDACQPNFNGCSAFFESCNGVSVRDTCNRHDTCYQCGMRCHGHTRAQCDAGFRAEVRQVTGSPLCAWIYWLGVRGGGWLFYQNPYFRPSMMGDVYSLGLVLNACPAQYYHLCTTYIF